MSACVFCDGAGCDTCTHIDPQLEEARARIAELEAIVNNDGDALTAHTAELARLQKELAWTGEKLDKKREALHRVRIFRDELKGGYGRGAIDDDDESAMVATENAFCFASVELTKALDHNDS